MDGGKVGRMNRRRDDRTEGRRDGGTEGRMEQQQQQCVLAHSRYRTKHIGEWPIIVVVKAQAG
jgi:hypothetical protein